jgi:hypothetical protein
MTPSPQSGTEVYGLPKSAPKMPSLPVESSAAAASSFASSRLTAEPWNCAAERRASGAERRESWRRVVDNIEENRDHVL